MPHMTLSILPRRSQFLTVGIVLSALVAATSIAAWQGRGNAVTGFTKVTGPVIALTHARVIDGTGAPARTDQTVIISGGNISAMGPSASTPPPAGATVVDLTGKSLIPGLVMLHEHLYYPEPGSQPTVYGQLGQSFVRLYLAGGVTTMRTAGNTNGVMDINLKHMIDGGQLVGPSIDATGPYLEGPTTSLQMHALVDAADARRQVAHWADMGATSFKAYMNITKAELGAAIDESHKRGLKLTGHLCSVTLSEAADLGIDDIEHAFFAATDFVPTDAAPGVTTRKPDLCVGQGVGQQSVADVDPASAQVQQLIKKLIDKHVALTSTLTVFETFAPGRPMPPGLDVLAPELKQQFERTYASTSTSTSVNALRYKTLLAKGMALELAFAKAGGMLVAGTDPTGSGGVIPGYADQRQIELLVEEGFTPLQAISICTLNGAKYLGRDAKIGSISIGKQADLVVIGGDPSTTIGDVRKVETVFRQGVGYDPAKLIQSVTGRVGLW